MLFNEPKLLKSELLQRAAELMLSFSALQRAEIAEIYCTARRNFPRRRFSALQRAEIAEMQSGGTNLRTKRMFQCSSTSRNC